METPSERDTHVDGTPGGGGSARQGHQEGGLLAMPWGRALSELSPEDSEREIVSLKQACLQCEGSCRSHMNPPTGKLCSGPGAALPPGAADR